LIEHSNNTVAINRAEYLPTMTANILTSSIFFLSSMPTVQVQIVYSCRWYCFSYAEVLCTAWF